MKNLTLIVVLIAAATFQVLAQTRTVTGSGDWSNTANWQGGSIGGAVDNDDDVVVNNAVNITVLSGETYTIATLSPGKDGSVTVDAGGVLIITGLVSIDKDFTLNIAGDLLIQGDMTVDKALSLNVADGGNFTVEGNVDLAKDANLDVQGAMDVDGDFITDKDAVVNVEGTLEVDGEFNLGAGSTITGSGEVAAPNCTGAACGDEQVASTLPITLGTFNLTSKEYSVVLNWTTLSEENFDYFEIQRADASMEFETIATLSGNGNSKIAIDYTWTDENPSLGTNYYRLISNDFDGYREIFKAEYVNFESASNTISIYPNPATMKSTINIKGNIQKEVTVTIYNMQGQVEKTLTTEYGYFDLNSELDKGIYIVELTTNSLQKRQRLIIR